MKMDILQTGPLGVNCYILSKDGCAIIVDPGGNQEDIEKYLAANGLKPEAVLNTHGHFDHIGAVAGLCSAFSIPFLMNEDDEFLLKEAGNTARMYGLAPIPAPVISKSVSDGDVLDLCGIKIKVIHTPGHTPGGCCYYIEEMNSVLTGDSLFHESIGRSDFPYGDGTALVNNIKQKLMILPDDVRIYPGHGPKSTIGYEKKYNPFL